MSDEDDEFIANHISYIRRMSLLDDNSIKALLKIKIAEDPSIIDKFKENRMKKQLDDIKLMAKDITTTPVKLGRKVA